jgi:hypothetical protein
MGRETAPSVLGGDGRVVLDPEATEQPVKDLLELTIV